MQPEILKQFVEDGGLVVRASGDCMSGTFPDGAKLLLKRKSLYMAGDVIVYARGDDTLVAHRLLGYLPGPSGWRVLTRADNAIKADHPAAISRVLGCVVQQDGVRLKYPLSTRLLAGLAYFPSVIGWLKQRRADQNPS